MNLYLLQENGSHILLENGAGAIILEEVGVPGPSINWQPGGAGYPVKKRKRRHATEELFKAIEHTLELHLGLVPLPVEGTQGPEDPPLEPAWNEERIREAVSKLEAVSVHYAELRERMGRVRAMLAAYEEAQAREQALDEEETWFLMA